MAGALAAGIIGSGLAAAPATAVTATPDPVYVLQGAEFGFNRCEYPSGPNPITVAFAARYPLATNPTAKVVSVGYSVCDYDPRTGASQGGGYTILNKAAAALASSIAANSPETSTGLPKVDVIGASLGGLVARRCAVLAYYPPTPADAPKYSACKRIDDLIGVVAPNHGSNAPTFIPVTKPTCSFYPCVNLPDGPHLKTASYCWLLLPLAQGVCQQLAPNSQSITGMNQPVIADETPGTTQYTSFYSYSDEIVVTSATTVVGGPHSGPLAGAMNIAAPFETHTSILNVTGQQRKRIALESTLTSPFNIKTENYPPATTPPTAAPPACGEEIIEVSVQLLADVLATTPGTSTGNCSLL